MIPRCQIRLEQNLKHAHINEVLHCWTLQEETIIPFKLGVTNNNDKGANNCETRVYRNKCTKIHLCLVKKTSLNPFFSLSFLVYNITCHCMFVFCLNIHREVLLTFMKGAKSSGVHCTYLLQKWPRDNQTACLLIHLFFFPLCILCEIKTHDKDTPWKNYLVVLEGNLEERVKKPKGSSGRKEKAADEHQAVEDQTDTKTQEMVPVPEEPVTISGDWADPGTITVVSHGTLGNLTVIQTEVPPGTQLQPLVTADGASVISLESSTVGIPVALPFSIPISVAHSISGSASLTGTLALSEPASVSDAILAPATSAAPVATVTEGILSPVEVTLSTSSECVTAQSEVEQVEEMQQSDLQEGTTEHVQITETVEAMEIAVGE